MIEIISGTIAAFIAYNFNKLIFKWKGKKAIVFLVPFIEEGSKSIIAYCIKANIIGTHFVFGMIEAIYDMIYTKSERAASIAAMISIISHSIFGLMTYYLNLWTDWLLFSIVVISVIHSLWNYFVTR